MSYLTFGTGAVVVRVADGQVEREEFAIGEVRAAFSGAPRSAVRGYNTTWKVTTIPITRSAADTLKGLLEATPPLTIAGDLTGSISGYVSDITTRSRTAAGGAEFVTLSFKIWHP